MQNFSVYCSAQSWYMKIFTSLNRSGEIMDFSRLEYIKNINGGTDWAYKDYPVCSYFRLNFKKAEKGDGVEAHVSNLPKGSLIILSQKSPSDSERYLTHVVELCNEHYEDEPQWDSGPWDIVRWVKVCWVADFSNVHKMPVDKKVMQAEWGKFDTKAKLLTSPSLMDRWTNIDNLKANLQEVFV